MGLGQPHRHRRSLNNTISPYKGEDSGEIANKLEIIK